MSGVRIRSVTLTPAAKPPGEGRTLSRASQCPAHFTASHGSFSANISCEDFFLKESANHRRQVTSTQLREGCLSSQGEEEAGVFPQGMPGVRVDVVPAEQVWPS